MGNDSAVPEKPGTYDALKIPAFRWFLVLRFFFTFAYQIQALIIGFHVYSLTKDPLVLGVMGLAEAVPALSIALYGGYVADKAEKKQLLLKVMAGMIFCSAVMLFVTSAEGHRLLSVQHIVWVLYLMIFGTGLARGFFSPAVFSLISHLVPRRLYTNSITWNSSSRQIASILGPAAGGLIYGYWGVTVTFTFVLAMFLLAGVAVLNFEKAEPIYVQRENILDSMAAGVKFVFKNKMMLAAMSLDLFSVFFGGAVALLPVVANDILKVGSEGLGFMSAFASAGSLISMLVMTRYSPMGKPWRNLLIAVVGFALSIIGYGLSRNFFLTLFLLFCEGAFNSISVIIRGTIMQLLVPDDMRGRVSSVNQMFLGSSNEIGAFESGLTAKLMGTVPAIVFGGGMTMVVAGITWLKTKSFIGVKLADIEAVNDKVS